MRAALLQALRGLAATRPRAGLRVARATATLTSPLGFGVEEERLGTVFPELTPAELTAARRRTWSNFLLGEALLGALTPERERPAYPALVPNPALERLEPPLILLSFHIGPYHALGAVLQRLPGVVLALHRDASSPRGKVTLVRAGDDAWDRARAFNRTAGALRAGGSVFAIADGVHDAYEIATVDAPLLGGTIALARGPFALSRLTGAPIVPLAARWRGTAAEVTVGEPIAPSRGEAEAAAATARWLEDYLRRFPGEAGAFLLLRLRLPPAA